MGVKKLKILRFSFVIVCIILALCMSGCTEKQQDLTVDELISLGEKYLLDLNYEQALIQFNKVIEIEPMNVRGYTGAAEAYIGLEQLDEAINILQKGHEKTEDVEIKNMLNELKSEKDEETQQTISENNNEYELSYFFEDALPVESLTIGGIPFYKHTSDFEEESFREFGVQLSVDEDEVFALVGSENFNEFAGLTKGMELSEVLNILGFTQEGISFIKEAQRENSNTSIDFYLSGTEPDFVSTFVGDMAPYDLSIIINYHDVIESFRNLYIVIGFYDNHIALLEAHAIKDYSSQESQNTDTYNAEDFLSYSAQKVTDIFGDDYVTSNDGGSSCFYYEDLRVPMVFFVGKYIKDNIITGQDIIKYIAVVDGEVIPGIKIGDTADYIAKVFNVEYSEPQYSDYEGFYQNVYDVTINGIESTIYFQFEQPDGGCIASQIKGNSLY